MTARRYRFCDFSLTSNVRFPELPPGAETTIECRFQLVPGKNPRFGGCRWTHEWRLAGGRRWLRFARRDSDYLLRFPSLADFLVAEGGIEVRCYPRPGTPPSTVRHLFLDQVVPLVLSRQGKLVLHASAVLTPSGAVAFLGHSGWGKSTLAASFAEAGFPVLSDDCLILTEEAGRLFAIPSYPGLRLWPDTIATVVQQRPDGGRVAHYTRKRRIIPPAGGDANPVPIRRMYVLSPPEDDDQTVQTIPLRPREAAIELTRYGFLMDIEDPAGLRQRFERVASAAALRLLHRLVFPRDFALLGTVRKAILEDLRQ